MEHDTRRDPPALVTVKQYAAEYGVTERTVYEWVRKGAIEARRHVSGGSIRIVRTTEDDAGA